MELKKLSRLDDMEFRLEQIELALMNLMFVVANPEKELSDFKNIMEKAEKEGKEKDWVFSDDGRIIQLLKVSRKIKHPKDRKNYKFAQGWCRTVVGTFLIRHNTIMDTDFSDHPNRYTFSKTIKNTGNRVKERKKVTNKKNLQQMLL